MPPQVKKRGRPRSRSAPALLRSPKKAKKRKQWSDESMAAAIEAVKGGESVLRAAKQYGVPRQTLGDRVSGKVVHGTNPGPKPFLNAVEEKELSSFLVDVAKAGYGKTRKQIMGLAESVARDKGRMTGQKRISDGWFRRFMQRQPQLSLRKGDATANVRMDCLTKETMDKYFDLLQDTLVENNLMESPNRIYNVDETGMPLNHCAPKIVTSRGHKKVRYKTSGNKSQITVIGCVSAIGHAIPPFVIFDSKSLNMEWRKGEIPGTSYGLSDKGWVDTELFRGWLTDHFLEHAVGARPLLILLDGHSSHCQPNLVRFAREHDIILFCLPPHTTHESQPLDASVFKPLKQNWQDACHEYVQTHPGKAVTKYQFSELLHKAWDKTMTTAVICSGFRRCGVYPFNPQAIDCSISTENPEASLTEPNDQQPETENGRMENGHENTVTDFSVEQEQRFQRRFEEGYDLMDPEYLCWLEINHPDSVPADRHMLVLAPESSADVSEDNPTLTDAFSFVQPSSPLPMTECALSSNPTSLDSSSTSASTTKPANTHPTLESTESVKTPTLESTNSLTTESAKTPPTVETTPRVSHTNSSKASATLNSMLQSKACMTTTPRTSAVGLDKTSPTLSSSVHTTTPVRTPSSTTSPTGTLSASLHTKTPVMTPSATPSPPGTSSGESDPKLKYISKYLVQVISDATPKSSTSAAKRVSGARVLTSAKCAAILEEREEKKKKKRIRRR